MVGYATNLSLTHKPFPLDGCPMFADFRVRGLSKTFFQCFPRPCTPTYRKEKGGGFAHLVQPMYAKVREHGAPVQGERLDGMPGKRWTN
jgi:hypothetical protein